jgi:hypothetical protein
MMILKLGWDSCFALSVHDAVTIAEILSKAHAWKEHYKEGMTTFHAYPADNKITMELISPDLFNMAKLAGKPEKK